MTIKPLQNYILCSIHEGREISIIQLPDASNPMQPYAKVIAVGPAVSLVSLGDRVLFAPENAIYSDEYLDENKVRIRTVIVPEGCCFARYVVNENAVEQAVSLN